MEALTFENRMEFRNWLSAHCEGSGVWLRFGKRGGPKTLTAAEALEEALCFGWIDGQMRKTDETSYVKYFAPRRPTSHWSAKNKELAGELIRRHLMTDRGRRVMETAKAGGYWDKDRDLPLDTPENLAVLTDLLKGHEPAAANFAAKPPSVQKTYCRMYFDAKSPEARQRRLEKIIGRLNRNLNPM